MAMQALYLKEHEGMLHNPAAQLSSVPSATPWWAAFGTQSFHGDSLGQSDSSPVENPRCGDHLAPAKQAGPGTEQGADKGSLTQFTIFTGDRKNSVDTQKSQLAISPLPEYCARVDLGYGQQMICAKYPYGEQCFGVFSPYGSQISGRMMLPLNLSADDGPIFVNAKQYHAIIRRRKFRAKAVLENKVTRVRKPYMHESRHRHAMRRPRGCGGRFLNVRSLGNGKGGAEAKKDSSGQFPQPTGSQSSEVSQSESGTLSLPKEANGSAGNLSGSEVTSMYSREELDRFPINHLPPSVYSFTGMNDTSHSIVMPSKWVAAVDNRRNLNV
ncbi:nuclear transcription factor Y subunit A-10-like [Rhodamnia argentea]|uniref:Nuclear transcription factor Y subunit n=1 Tax=Rhodamnia argentea TaxID=178133 RepID=A0A8B8R2V1_9MYRT|nr:nuclear transcription factor Y subunit A-10-like [Rhodamnia argentea]XP_030553805.1 nuclear transcription factor Y subunit A-10-like [Rhodamnia argentea]